MKAEPIAPQTKAGATRTKTTRTRPTARAIEPLQDLAEIASAPSLSWAMTLWARMLPGANRLRELARRIDLSHEASAIARTLDANPCFVASKEGRAAKRQVCSLLASLMTLYGTERATPAPATPKKSRRRRKAS